MLYDLEYCWKHKIQAKLGHIQIFTSFIAIFVNFLRQHRSPGRENFLVYSKFGVLEMMLNFISKKSKLVAQEYGALK